MSSFYPERPERVTTRAQIFLLITAVGNLTLGWFLIRHQEVWHSSSYEAIFQVMPMTNWGVAMMITGTLCAVAAAIRREGAARVGVALAALTAGTWFFGFMAGELNGTLAGPSGPIAWGTITAFHLLQCRSPLRLPLEPVLRRLADQRR